MAGQWLRGLTAQTPKPLPLLLAPGPAEQKLSGLPYLICKRWRTRCSPSPAEQVLLELRVSASCTAVTKGQGSGLGVGVCSRDRGAWAGRQPFRVRGGGAIEGKQPQHPHRAFAPKCRQLDASGCLSRGRRGTVPGVGRRL